MSAAKEKTRTEPEDIEFVEANWEVPQFYRADPLLMRFFEELKHKRLLASKAPGENGRVIFPPSNFCEVTYSEITELVPVGPNGIVRSFTVVPTASPHSPPPPYVIVFVQLEGADTASPGYLRGLPEQDMYSLDLVGTACRAVFVDDPKGNWADFWFELAK